MPILTWLIHQPTNKQLNDLYGFRLICTGNWAHERPHTHTLNTLQTFWWTITDDEKLRGKKRKDRMNMKWTQYNTRDGTANTVLFTCKFDLFWYCYEYYYCTSFSFLRLFSFIIFRFHLNWINGCAIKTRILFHCFRCTVRSTASSSYTHLLVCRGVGVVFSRFWLWKS